MPLWKASGIARSYFGKVVWLMPKAIYRLLAILIFTNAARKNETLV